MIFDIETEESAGINMADVRDIVDFLSVCQAHSQVGRGEMAARAQKPKIVIADNHDRNENSAEAMVSLYVAMEVSQAADLHLYSLLLSSMTGRWTTQHYKDGDHNSDLLLEDRIPAA